jgi:hypothetical protein
LSEWLRAYDLGSSNESERIVVRREQEDAADAIKNIGTNALPWLLKRIAYDPPVWKEKIGPIAARIHSRLLTRWYLEGDRLSYDALEGFRVLGPRAAPAVPELARMIRNGSRRGVGQDWRMRALSYIGKEGFPPLLAALNDPRTKYDAARCIERMSNEGGDIGPAIPALLLIDRSTAEHARKRREANPGGLERDYMYFISYLLFENRPFLIPALTNGLHHTNSDVRVEAAEALGRLYYKARPAVPALRDALDDRVIAVQEAAITALEKIAPEVLTNGTTEVSQ